MRVCRVDFLGSTTASACWVPALGMLQQVPVMGGKASFPPPLSSLLLSRD